jgi:acyl-CoA thioesterase
VTTFERALHLDDAGAHVWTGRADPAYAAATGMYGGFTSALLLKSVLAEPAARTQGPPSAFTAHFLNRIEPDAALTFRTRMLESASKSHGFWQSEVFQGDQRAPSAAATVILTTRRENDGFNELKMPDAPPPEQIEAFHPPFPYAERTAKHFIKGFPPFNSPDTHSLGWSRELTGRKVDAIQLAFLSDNFPPRSWFISSGLRATATLTHSLYFLATPEEMAAVGEDAVLMAVDGTRGAGSLHGVRVNMWSRAGVLLATSEQLAWYK